MAGGETGEERRLGGLKRGDVEECERGEAVGERGLGVGGGCGGAGENGGEFSGGVSGGDCGLGAAETVAEGAEPERVGAGLGDEVDERGAFGGGARGGADLDEFGDKRGGGLRGGEVAREGGQ